MNLKKINSLVFICFFPTFIVRSNLSIGEIIFTLFIFIAPVLIINHVMIKRKILNNFFFRFYLSLITVYGIDNHLGLWSGVIQPFRYTLIDIFGVIYFPGLLLFIFLLVLINYIILIGKDKFFNVILIFMCTIFIFGIFDQTKSYKKVKSFIIENDKKYNKTKLIIVFDEMSGLKSFESSNYNGSQFNTYARKFFKKHNFEFHSNVESVTSNTGASLSAMLNFTESPKTREKVLKKSSNFFFEYELTKNLFFETYKDISIYQTIHIDFCNPANISKCESYNPYTQKEFLNGFKDSYLSKIVSIWKLNGSISSAIIWRSLRELRIIDSLLEPEGHKATFQNLFQSLEKDIYSKKFDLIFVHTLVPHIPYGFDTNCNYDGSASIRNRYFSVSKKVKQHNIERKCVLIYLDMFLENLKANGAIESIDLTILSDHGARIVKRKDSQVSSIYAVKNNKTNYKEIKEKSTMQRLFIEYFK